LFTGLALWPRIGWACNVPVFRYALERWRPDAYPVVIFHRGALTPEHLALIEPLEKAARDGAVNLAAVRVNLSEAVSKEMQALWQAQSNSALPCMVVRYPPAQQAASAAWAGPLTSDAVKALTDSPVRRELLRRLARGDSVVWLLLESGSKEQDDPTARLLETESRNLEKTLRLPEPAPDDPPMRADLPWKIAFSTLRLARTDPAEQMLVNLLLRWDAKLPTLADPMVFAIIGRGRSMPPLVGKEIRADVIGKVANFLVEGCSCEVKALNPGFDLLMTADWDALIEGRWVKDPELPPLMGLSQFASAASNKAAGPLAVADPAPESAEGGGLVRNLLLVLGIGALVLAGGTFVLRAKSPKPPS
jgi:hypothetical protein